MIRYAYWVAALAFAGLVAAKFDPQTGFTSLVRFGETWQNRRHSSLQKVAISTVLKSNGYDGQFYAQIALSPALRDGELDKIIDAPAYRARRILVPAIAAALGGQRPGPTLQAYSLLNVVCWFCLGWLLKKIIGREDWRGFARWFACMFSVGVLDSVRQSLVDLPALLLLALAVDCRARQRLTRGTCWLALSNLAKETSFLGACALNVPELLHSKSWFPALRALVLSTLPLAIWWYYVDHRFSAQATDGGLGNFTWPLIGVIQHAKTCLDAMLHGNFDGRFSFGALAVLGLFLQAIVLARITGLQSDWWRIGIAYALLLPFFSLWVWGGYWAACRAVLPLTVSFNLLLPSNRYFWPVWIFGNLTVFHAIWRFL